METDSLLGPKTGSASGSDSYTEYESTQHAEDTDAPSDGNHGVSINQHVARDDRMTTAQKKLLACLVMVRILNGSLVAIMIPFFPVEAASRGVSQTVISSLFTAFALAKMIMSPFIGRLAPLLGIKWLYNFGVAASGLATIVFGTLNYIADTSAFVAACFLVRLMEAAGSAATAVCSFTIIGSQFPSRVNRVVALLGSALTIGMALTPAIWGGLFALGGFGIPFYTLGVIMLLMAAVNQRLMPTIEKTTSESQTHLLSSLRLLAGSTGNWVCMATAFIIAADVSTVDSALAPYANDVLGVASSQVGLFYIVSTTLYAGMNFFWGSLAERVQNRYKVMSPCLLVASLAILLVAPSSSFGLNPSWWVTGLGMTLELMFIGGAITPCFKIMLDSGIERGLEDSLSTLSLIASVYQMTFSLGIAVGPLSGGIIVDMYGFPCMIIVLALATAAVGVLVGVKAVFVSLRHMSAYRCRA
ncbi:MFS-type transporter SLC18B1-like [Pollicipes pollicipes]|uniref:MFS-type transporter SLC18B1-like n=1 Tax=Pollicipes pollicipes TaxID=41117 RepID=UPI0018856B2C|nr:MFS-type transporter SLC18B1-like [Pollicipes pollicipes]